MSDSMAAMNEREYAPCVRLFVSKRFKKGSISTIVEFYFFEDTYGQHDSDHSGRVPAHEYPLECDAAKGSCSWR